MAGIDGISMTTIRPSAGCPFGNLEIGEKL